MPSLSTKYTYIGQAGRTFKTRYKEHTQIVRNNSGNYGYPNHIISTEHIYGTTTDTVGIIIIINATFI
jgi:hypothetical protein